MNKQKLADRITDALFHLGSEPQIECTRIQFIGNRHPNETEMGGLCKEAFRDWILKELQWEPTKREIDDGYRR